MSPKRFLVLGVVLFLGAAVSGACGGRSDLLLGDDGGADAGDAAADAEDAMEGSPGDAGDASEGGEAGDASEGGPVEAGEAGDATADVEAGTDSSFIDSSMFEAGSDSAMFEAGNDSSIPDGGKDGATDSGVEGGPKDGGGPEGGEAGLDAASEGSSPITCGMATCDPTTQECCVSRTGAACAAIGQCTGLNLSCTGTDNCTGGDVCCVTFGGGLPSSSCQPSCAGGPGGGIQLCTGNQDCTPPRTCRQTPLGFGICR